MRLVSSHDQKEDLVRQIKVLENYSSNHGWQDETISALGSGLNYKKKGLKQLLNRILTGDVGRLVLIPHFSQIKLRTKFQAKSWVFFLIRKI